MKKNEIENIKAKILKNEILETGLIESIPGGVAVFANFADGESILVYCNNQLCRLSGISKEEIETVDYWEICKVIKEDKSKVLNTIQKAIVSENSEYTTYRTRNQKNEIQYIQLNISTIRRENDILIIYVIYNDITDAEKKKIEIQQHNEEMRHTIDNGPGGVFRCKMDGDWEVLNANKRFYDIIGYTKKEFKEQHDNLFGKIIPSSDKQDVISRIDEKRAKGNHINAQHRIISKGDKIKWIDMQAEYVKDVDDNYYLYCIFLDVTEEEELKKQLKLYRSSDLNGVFSVVLNKNYTLIYGNDKYYQMHEYTKETMKKMINNNCAQYIYPEDLDSVNKIIHEAREKGQQCIKWEMRVITGRGNLRHTLCSGTFEEVNKIHVLNGVVIDITEQKKVEEALRESQNKVRIATENSNMSFWTYEFKSKSLIDVISSKKKFGNSENAKNIPEALVLNGNVNTDSVHAFYKMYEELENGAKRASGDFWFKTKNENDWCEHIDYVNVFDENGKPIRAYGASKDVTIEKRAERRYIEEVKYAKVAESEKLLAKVCCNITKNVIESYIAKDIIGVDEKLKKYDDGVERIARAAFTKTEENKIRSNLERKHIIKAFQLGETDLSMEYRRRLLDGDVIWVKTTVKIYEQPDTEDVLVFMYTYDINEEKLKLGIIETVTALEYDYIAYMDLKSNKFSIYIGGAGFKSREDSNRGDFVSAIRETDEYVIISEDLERINQELMPDRIRINLETRRVFSTVFSVHDKNKEIRQKRLQYAYLDKESEQIVLTRSDVTNVLKNQKQQQDTLEVALLAAEQANIAKTDFLSRMSHEIRTPMNAIIGMSAIALQSIGNDEQVSNCITKIGSSSRYLLSLINDILDMSRIESGKLFLKSEEILLEDFINEINSICYIQAKRKNINYECIMDSNVEDYYIGDAMKLQQIIINLISNAIKFTPEKGSVNLNISQVKKYKQSAMIRIVVSDTGCGMTEAFVPHIFEAFVQEHIGNTSKYGGTGLGLAICKNLVDMMDGKISVKSTLDVGTEFTVDVKLGLTKEIKAKPLKKLDNKLSNFKALIVDDDVSICEHTLTNLKDMGIKAEWVDSGIKAVEKVKTEWKSGKQYDLILMDWKMPEMDGIETTKEIRKILGADVSIIMMAYDWVAIEGEAKAAGVNLLINKPLFKTNLVSAFNKIMSKEPDNKILKPKNMYFKNKRILLAEDHPLNVEVAKRLLSKVGFEVDNAEDGLKALEMFKAADYGYYDAILMDIRMPQMDGLEAARTIRSLSKETAKTIPIIAMTANAFEEDIEKSRSVGMNEHLTKPIEPNHLYEILYDFIYGDRGNEKE